MGRFEDLEREIIKIKERNARVEGDKACETSFTRRTVIVFGTYLFTAFFLLLINAPNPLFTALVPALAFIVSTLTLPPIKSWWLKKKTPKRSPS